MAIDGDEKARGRSRSPAPEKKKREKWKRSRSRDRRGTAPDQASLLSCAARNASGPDPMPLAHKLSLPCGCRHHDKDRTKDRDKQRHGEHRSERDRGHDRELRDRERGRERDRDRAHDRDKIRDRCFLHACMLTSCSWKLPTSQSHMTTDLLCNAGIGTGMTESGTGMMTVSAWPGRRRRRART